MRISMRRPPLPSVPVLLAAVALAAWLALTPVAYGAESPLDEYQRTGTISPCNPGIYEGGAAPNDVQQYAPDYLQALQDARRKGCARGGDGGNAGTAAVPPSGPPPSGPSGAAPGTAYVPKPPAPPKATTSGKRPSIAEHLPLAARADGGTPVPILALAIMLLLVALGGVLAAVGRYLGWGSGLLDPVRHAGGEAALRAGSLADRLRDLTRRRG
jgi:hypothetical protein